MVIPKRRALRIITVPTAALVTAAAGYGQFYIMFSPAEDANRLGWARVALAAALCVVWLCYAAVMASGRSRWMLAIYAVYWTAGIAVTLVLFFCGWAEQVWVLLLMFFFCSPVFSMGFLPHGWIEPALLLMQAAMLLAGLGAWRWAGKKKSAQKLL